MTPSRFLIVNADDLGLSPGVNAGIAAAHDRGIVTSASLMVHGAAAGDGADLARTHGSLAVGLHVDLGEWVYGRGEWRAVYERCPLEDGDAIERECRTQLDAFRRLLGHDPTHLDSHQHVHAHEPAATVVAALARELRVPVRGARLRYEGGFYGQTGRGDPYPEGVSVDRLVGLIESLPPGWTELGCHPGIGVGAESPYASERPAEVEALCDPRVRAAIEAGAIELRSFADVEI